MCFYLQEITSPSSSFSSKTLKWHKAEQGKKSDGFTTNLLKTIQSTMAQHDNGTIETDDEFDNVIKKEVDVLKVNGPDLIYVQFQDEWIRKRYIEMDTYMQDFYFKNKPEVKSLAVGDKCVIYKKKMDHFYRAKVLDITDNKILVELFDSTDVYETDKSNIYFLDDKFRVYPNFVIKCHLDGILPAGDSKKWSFLALDYLDELFKNKSKILMTKSAMFDPDKNSLPCVMWYVELVCNGPLEPTLRKLHCINKELVTNGLALNKRTIHKKRCSTPLKNEVITAAVSMKEKIEKITVTEQKPIIVSGTVADYMSAPPLKKSKLIGIVTYVDAYGAIYMQDFDMQKPFEEMVMQMNEYFNKTKPEETDFQEGDLCTVMYHDNEYWYRGKIVKRQEDGTYKVYVIDYGNEETCKPEHLRKTVMYLNVPSFSHKVKLHNVFAIEKKWLASDIDVLQTLLNDQKVIVIVKKRATARCPPLVEMYIEDGRSVNEFMIEYSSNLSRKPIRAMVKPASPDSDDDVIIDDIVEEIVCSPEPEQNMYRSPELPSVGSKFEVGIINVLNYNDLIFEYNSNTENEDFVKLSASLQDEGNQQSKLNVIKVGQPCIAQYSEDCMWYRAQIVEMLSSEVVKVWFVDFGNFEDIKMTKLKEIKREWLNYPLQQYRAELYGLKLKDETNLEKVLQFWMDYCGTVQYIRIVQKNPLKIEMYKSNTEEELLYQNLIEKGILSL